MKSLVVEKVIRKMAMIKYLIFFICYILNKDVISNANIFIVRLPCDMTQTNFCWTFTFL